MPTTINWNLTYPPGAASPNVPLSLQTLAEEVDAALTKLRDGEPWEYNTLVATSGWSLHYSAIRRVGSLVSVEARLLSETQYVYEGQTQDGNIANMALCNVPDTYLPSRNQPLMGAGGAGAAGPITGGFINTGGIMSLLAMSSGATVEPGKIVSLAGTYLLG